MENSYHCKFKLGDLEFMQQYFSWKGGTLIDNMYTLLSILNIISPVKKAVPLHAMEAHGGRGSISPTHT
jgi:hypothetical protein